MPDEARTFQGSTEPFYLTSRVMGEKDLKLIWWFVAAINEHEEAKACEDRYDRILVGYEEALDKITFREDREIVEKAVQIVKATME